MPVCARGLCRIALRFQQVGLTRPADGVLEAENTYISPASTAACRRVLPDSSRVGLPPDQTWPGDWVQVCSLWRGHVPVDAAPGVYVTIIGYLNSASGNWFTCQHNYVAPTTIVPITT